MSSTSKLLMVTLIASVLAVAPGIVGLRIGYAQSDVLLTGTITSAAGEKMEGVAVSARGAAKSFTISVFTDAAGEYYFPPMPAGKYKVWAQARGYGAGRAEVGLSRATARQDFALKDVTDFEAQLTGAEWVDALPEDTPEDRRMKEVFRLSCGGCHSENTSLLTRFDEKGWNEILRVMSRIATSGYNSSDDRPPNPLIEYYRERLAAYLAKVRGPGPSPMTFKPRPRPSGDATLVVVREYDVPGNGYGLPLFLDGSDWSQGAPSKLDKKNHHAIDGTLDFDGNLWFSDDLNSNPYRSVGKIDWRTGKVTNFIVRRADGLSAPVHDIVTHQDGTVWFGADGKLTRIDPKTGRMDTFSSPQGWRVGGFQSVDGKGNVWSLSGPGALRFNPNSQEWTTYTNPIQKSKLGSTGTYGMAGDPAGNGWWSQYPLDIMIKADGETGQTLNVQIPKVVPAADLFTGDDRRIFDMMGGNLFQGRGMPDGQGIRKPGSGWHADAVWGPAWHGDNLIKIDYRTNRVVAQYPFPIRHGGVYQAHVDRDGMVWVVYTNADAIGKFDPKTARWTTYELPTVGTETHGMQVVAVNGRTQVAVPQWASGKMSKLEFRTRAELQALKAEAQQP